MPGLVPGIHVVQSAPSPSHSWFGRAAWMPTDQDRGLKAHGSSPAMTVVVAEIIRLLSDGHLAFSSLCSWIPGSRATPAPRNDDLILCQSLTERAHSERRKINRPRCAEAGSALKLPIKQVIGPFTQNWFDFRLTLQRSAADR